MQEGSVAMRRAAARQKIGSLPGGSRQELLAATPEDAPGSQYAEQPVEWTSQQTLVFAAGCGLCIWLGAFLVSFILIQVMQGLSR